MGTTDARTLVLVGKTGNGKSATGNSILGTNKFLSKRSFSGVTTTSELVTTELEDGQMVNVIDTPGLFDSSVGPETIGEILSCIKLAIDGIHAVLVVFSVCHRFSEEEKAVISSLQDFFGTNICDYMIVVFTGADEIEENGKTLDDFLSDGPEALKEILCLCGNRFVFFNNRTNDQTKKSNQVQQLLSLVNMVVQENGEEPYTNEVFKELKKWTREIDGQTEEFLVLKKTKGYSEQEMFAPMEQMKQKIDMIETMVMEIKLKFEQDLLEERTARLKDVRENVEAAIKKAEKDINCLRTEIETMVMEINSKFEQKLLEEQAARFKVQKNFEAAIKKAEEDIATWKKMTFYGSSR